MSERRNANHNEEEKEEIMPRLLPFGADYNRVHGSSKISPAIKNARILQTKRDIQPPVLEPAQDKLKISHKMDGWFGTTDCETIDGMKFVCWETEDEMNEFTRLEEARKRLKEFEARKRELANGRLNKIIVPTKTTDITKIKGWREKVFASPNYSVSKQVYLKTLCTKVPTSPSSNGPTTLPKLDCLPNAVSQNSSAFVSDFLDDYLKNNELKLKNFSDMDITPPEDSPILSTGILKMSDNTKRPPSLSSSWTIHKDTPHVVTDLLQSKRNRKRKKFDDEDIVPPVFKMSNGRMSKVNVFQNKIRVKKKKESPSVNNDAGTVSDNVDKDLGEEHYEYIFNEFMSETYAEIQNKKKQVHLGIIMDEAYARFAIEALGINFRPDIDSPGKKSLEPQDMLSALGLKPLTSSESDKFDMKDLTPILGRINKKKDADIAKIISRHSKRDIRLPARYHQSSLLMGNQWIIPEMDIPVKKGKKRLIEEQKRLQLQQNKLITSSKTESENQPQNLYSEQIEELCKLHSKYQTNSLSDKNTKNRAKKRPIAVLSTDYLNQRKKRINSIRAPHLNLQSKIKKQRLQQLKKKLELQTRSETQESDLPKLSLNHQLNHIGSLSQSPNFMKNVTSRFATDSDSKSIESASLPSDSKKNELKELYRNLYYENKPERKLLFAQRGMKPRVNKKNAVDEGIAIVEKVIKRDRQLIYIKKLLQMWNNKLLLCKKVIDKNEGGMTSQIYKVVEEVLNAYQSSVCYKVSEALDVKRREFTAALQRQQLPSNIQGNTLDNSPIRKNEHTAGNIPMNSLNQIKIPNFARIPVPIAPKINLASTGTLTHKATSLLSPIQPALSRVHDLRQLVNISSSNITSSGTSKPTVVKPTTFIIISPTSTLTTSGFKAQQSSISSLCSQVYPTSGIADSNTDTSAHVSNLKLPNEKPSNNKSFKLVRSQVCLTSGIDSPVSHTLSKPHQTVRIAGENRTFKLLKITDVRRD